jgi:23S rRNA (cytidine1920-2'-O)/16S rRNA (cytidine1409-2'-O)-methyltransferase
MSKERKSRLDLALVERGLAPDLKRAQALVMAGEVLVNGHKADKSDRPVGSAEAITIKARSRYVSRGALKIAKAVAELGITVPGLKVLDIGISTGGFSDFFLQHGAAEAFGVDVTIDQVDPRLRADPRLRLLETNARFLKGDDVPFAPDLVVMDLSFISITAVLPVLSAFPGAPALVLVKPQFEARRGRVGRGGVVRDRQARRDILLRLKHRVEELGFAVCGWCAAGVKGRRGNQEYFFLLRRGKNNSIDDKMIADAEEI